MTNIDTAQDAAQEAPQSHVNAPEAVPATPRPRNQLTAPVRAGRAVQGIIPGSLAEVAKLAAVTYESGLAPYGFKNVQSVAVAILFGAELGLPPMQSLQTIAVINGRPCIYGDGGIALIRASGLLESWKEWFTGEPFEDDYTAHCLVKRFGEEPVEREFSVADAKLAGLWGKMSPKGGPTPWVTYPKDMLRWRARNIFRTVFADVTKGLRFKEEVQDDPTFDQSEPALLTSGLADRLAGNSTGEGFNKDHIDREINGGEAQAQEHDTDGEGVRAGDNQSVVGLSSETEAPAEEAKAEALTEAEQTALANLTHELVGAVTPIEISATWNLMKSEFEHLSEAARREAERRVELKLAKSEKPKKRK